MARGCFSVCMLMHADADASGFEMKLRSFFQLITLSSLLIFYSMGGWLGGRGVVAAETPAKQVGRGPPQGRDSPLPKKSSNEE